MRKGNGRQDGKTSDSRRDSVRATKLYYGHQFVDKADVKAVEEVLTSDYLTCGPKVAALEEKLCEITGQNMRSLSATARRRSI